MVEMDHYGDQFSSYKKGDLHSHTSFSRGNLLFDGVLPPQQVVERAVEEELDFLAVTDHDDVEPSFLAKEHALLEGYDIEVITGAEVSSRDGHILALGIETNIPFWMSAKETVRAIHRAGGKAIAAHPFFRLTSSLGERNLREIAEDDDPEVFLDAIEVFNAGENDWRFVERLRRFWQRDGNRRARNFYTREGASGDYGAAVAGSDAHNKGVGRAVTIIPENMDIFAAIAERRTGVKMMDGKEGNSPRTMLEIRRRSHSLEQTRMTMSPGNTFPLRELAVR